jgi:quinol monooxygenase YgiN
MAGVVLLPWYATLFRGDDLERALSEIAPAAMRYGALEYDVMRSHGDTYKFVHYSTWDEHLQFEAYWYGPEFRLWRSDYQSWFQVPIVYEWYDRVVRAETRQALGHPIE